MAVLARWADCCNEDVSALGKVRRLLAPGFLWAGCWQEGVPSPRASEVPASGQPRRDGEGAGGPREGGRPGRDYGPRPSACHWPDLLSQSSGGGDTV